MAREKWLQKLGQIPLITPPFTSTFFIFLIKYLQFLVLDSIKYTIENNICQDVRQKTLERGTRQNVKKIPGPSPRLAWRLYKTRSGTLRIQFFWNHQAPNVFYDPFLHWGPQPGIYAQSQNQGYSEHHQQECKKWSGKNGTEKVCLPCLLWDKKGHRIPDQMDCRKSVNWYQLTREHNRIIAFLYKSSQQSMTSPV